MSTCKYKSYGVTDVGKVRKINEDRFLDRQDIGLWCVADGMGGHAAGDVASTMIVDSLAKIERTTVSSDDIDQIEDCLIEVNQNLRDIAVEREIGGSIGSTVVVVVTFENKFFYLWAGDSRLYRTHEGETYQVTRDHTHVEELVQHGVITAEEAEVHPDSNVITRAVGAENILHMDCGLDHISIGDKLLICSDGLTKLVTDKEVSEYMKTCTDPQQTVDTLLALCMDRGAVDNVTILIIMCE